MQTLAVSYEHLKIHSAFMFFTNKCVCAE